MGEDLILRHVDILPLGQQVHLARALLGTRRPSARHGHDFHELLWVQNGRVRHFTSDKTEDLTEGDLRFIRPGDAHALQGRGEAAMIVSVTLHPDLVAGILSRHPDLDGTLFWSRGDAPAGAKRDLRQMADLNQAALRLERSRLRGLDGEAFVLPLCASLADEAVPLPNGAPDWLVAACAAARDPRVFREGAAGFARAAGRAHPHVSRTMRRFTGQSPSDYINLQRMAFAARRLAGSSDPLAEIAADCGIPNLSHFHKLFRAHHRMTPLHYRRAHQQDVIQPD
jgi:AraC family transcriptional regulator, dual regulator of chb operon